MFIFELQMKDFKILTASIFLLLNLSSAVQIYDVSYIHIHLFMFQGYITNYEKTDDMDLSILYGIAASLNNGINRSNGMCF